MTNNVSSLVEAFPRGRSWRREMEFDYSIKLCFIKPSCFNSGLTVMCSIRFLCVWMDRSVDETAMRRFTIRYVVAQEI